MSDYRRIFSHLEVGAAIAGNGWGYEASDLTSAIQDRNYDAQILAVLCVIADRLKNLDDRFDPYKRAARRRQDEEWKESSERWEKAHKLAELFIGEPKPPGRILWRVETAVASQAERLLKAHRKVKLFWPKRITVGAKTRSQLVYLKWLAEKGIQL